ncbi:MAG: response regulator transcription factor [Elusimicrobiota bacterium]
MASERNFLIISTAPERRKALASFLTETSARVTSATSAQEAAKISPQSGYCGIFVDADDLQIHPLNLCARLRKAMPVNSCALILFGRGLAGKALVRIIDAGADDYWAVPFNAAVCLAYLRAILRRVTRIDSTIKLLKVGALAISPNQRQARLGREIIPLRAKEFDLLFYLAQHAEQALSRTELLQAVWGYEYFGTTRTIDFHVSRLREKLGRRGGAIQTIPGIGYRFNLP